MLDLPNIAHVQGHQLRWGKSGMGPPLVALHGTPFSAQVWRRIVPHLAAHRTVYYYDMPGYGQSQMRAGQDVSLAVQNKVLAHLLQQWGLTRPDVVAHDFGGATALRAYYLDGLRYASLTIFDAVALSPWGSPLVQHVRQHQQAFAGLPDYMHQAMLRAYLQTAAHQPLSSETLEIYAAPWIGTTGQAAFYRQITQMDQTHTDQVQDMYGPMTCPVTVLWGAQDTWIPLHMGQELANRIAGGRLRVVPKAGHLLQEDCPEAIIAALLETCLSDQQASA